MSGCRIGALIVDDQADVRLLLRLVLESAERDVDVVGEAASGEEALRLLETVQADCVVLDIMMPGMDGIETARRIREQRPDQKILFCSAHLDDQTASAVAMLRHEACVAKDQVGALPQRMFELLAC